MKRSYFGAFRGRSHMETEGKRGGTSGLDNNMTETRTGILQNAPFSKMSKGHGLF